MYDVSVHLDESAVAVCVVHEPCEADGKAIGTPTCERLYVYGVGASVIETSEDREYLASKLSDLRVTVAARNGVSTSRRMVRFRRDGWHATDDQPEFADPLIRELDLYSPHKGHVRYAVFESPQQVEPAYEALFVHVLTAIISRYKHATSLSIVFEASSGMTEEGCRRIVKLAGGGEEVMVERQPKGSDLLAVADYLLYSAIQYAARNAQICALRQCGQNHVLPIGSTVAFDGNGSPKAAGHVSKDDRWHKLYFAFVRGMSSLVEVASTRVATSSSGPVAES